MTDRTRKALTAARDLLARSPTYQERHDALRLIDEALADRSLLDELDALRTAAGVALEVLDHYQHGGSESRKPAVRAIEALRAAINTKEAT
jgi:hypothetical protein